MKLIHSASLCALAVPIVAAVVMRPQMVPWIALGGQGFTAAFTFIAWRDARGTALRPAVAWLGVACIMAVISQTLAVYQPRSRWVAMHEYPVYLTALALIAALTTVLNARRPGAGAWAFLIGVLLILLVVPGFDAGAFNFAQKRLGRLRLEMPWSLFFGLLAFAGAGNFIATRFALPAALLALGFAVELYLLGGGDPSQSVRAGLASAFPGCLALASALALIPPRSPAPGVTRCDRAWRWFRDRWGAAWGLRVIERFNREAELAAWPVVLTWHGLVDRQSSGRDSRDDPGPAPDAYYPTLRQLLRRFVDAERLDSAAPPASAHI